MLTRRVEREKKLSGISIDIRKEIINDFRNYFEFELTNDQLTSLGQVLNDLSKKVPMRRMLQGEVGSGKTLVALISLFAVINSGLQGAMMAPTEILAEQHYLNVIKNFKGEPFLDYDKTISKIIHRELLFMNPIDIGTFIFIPSAITKSHLHLIVWLIFNGDRSHQLAINHWIIQMKRK